MKNTLKITHNYGSPYEAARDRYSSYKFFDENEWRNISLGNSSFSLDSYMDMLDKSQKFDIETLNKNYNFNYSDSETRLAALYNEAYADRDNSNKVWKRPKLNEQGVPFVDDLGNTIMEEYTTSDYEYYKSIIKERNNYNYQQWLKQEEQERKNSMSGFSKFMATAAGVGTEFVWGFSKQLNDVVDFVDSAGGAAINTLFYGEDFSDKFVNRLSDDKGRPLQGLEDAIIDFESRYTKLRDLDGNYTNLGIYLGGISSTIGQLLPSILVGKGIGYVAGSTAGTAGTVASAASQLVFYTGMTSGNIRDMYQRFALEGQTVSSEHIIANAAIKSTLQYGVEIALGKILGGSAFDNLVFGRSAGNVTGKTLAKAGLKRIGKDFLQEGLEEVFQDTSDFFVDKAFMYAINENFGEITDLTFRSLFDAFIIGGIVSFGGNATKIIASNSKGFEGNIFNKKISSWEYGLNIQSFISNFDAIIKNTTKASDGVVDVKFKNNNDANITALTQMYASYRMLASIYGNWGEERFKSANAILSEITQGIKSGRFDSDVVLSSAEALYNDIFGENNIDTEYNKYVSELERARLAEEVARLNREDVERLVNEEGVDLNDETSNDIRTIMAGIMERKDTINEVVATKYGEDLVNIKGTVIIPVKFLRHSNKIIAETTLNQMELVNDVIENSGTKYKININEIVDTYRKLTGYNKATESDIITTLLFDKKLYLFRSLLINANKDMYSFLAGITNYINTLSKTNVSDAIFKKTLTTIKTNMISAIIQYLKVQPNADYQLPFLSKSQINSIVIERWANDIYSRVILGEELSERDMNVLLSRINNLPLDKPKKDVLIKNLNSTNSDIRESVINTLNKYYNDIFTTKYDGETYMPLTSIPNQAFNEYLQSNGLTLKNWLSLDAVTEDTSNAIITVHGELNDKTLRAFRINQFESGVNNIYKVEINNDKVNIVDADTYKRVGYSTYNSKLEAIRLGDKSIKRSFSTVTNDSYNIIKSIVNQDTPDAVANMLTLNDVIYDSELLTEEIRDNILTEYGNVNPETVFMYLRTFVLGVTEGKVTITVGQYGNYYFVNVTSMDNIFTKKKLDINDDTKISDIVKSKFLKGLLTKTKIKITNRNIAAEYQPYKIELVNGKPHRIVDNTIYIGYNTAKGNQDYLRFALAHEIQHVIQFENELNLGMNENWIYDVKPSVKKAIIADVKSHMPHLFSENMSEKELIDIVSKFVYHTSGESMAMGVDTTEIVDFYPTVVSYVNGNVTITFPWGTSFAYDKVIKSSGATVTLLSRNDTDEELINTQVKNNTGPYSIAMFQVKPLDFIIMTDGTCRCVENKEISDVINSVNVDNKQFVLNRMPQIKVIKDEFGTLVNIRVTTDFTELSYDTLVKFINMLYKMDIDFTLESIYYNTPSNLNITSDTAVDAKGILKRYFELIQSASYKPVSLLGPDKLTMSFAKTIKTDTEPTFRGMTVNDYPEEKNHKYKSRKFRLDKSGNVVTKLNKFGDVIPVFDYHYEGLKTRRVSKKESENNNLRFFVEKELSNELKTFILHATGDRKVVKVLQDKIDGRYKGTLTKQDVLDYFRDTDLYDIDVVTFEAINEAFFKNEIIKTPKELDNFLVMTNSFYALRPIIRQLNPEFVNVTDVNFLMKVKETVESAIQTKKDLGKNLSKTEKLYLDLLNRYYVADGIDITPSEKYLKVLWMRLFDGSVDSAAHVANAARYVAKWGYNTTGSITSGSTDTSIGDGDATLGDFVEDSEAAEAIYRAVIDDDETFEDYSYDEKRDFILENVTPEVAKIIANTYGKTTEGYQKAQDFVKTLSSKLNRLSDEQVDKLLELLTQSQINEIYVKKMISENLGLQFKHLFTSIKVNNAIEKITRTPVSVARAIKSNVRTIVKHLSVADKKRFLKHNSDLFTNELKLRPEVYKNFDRFNRGRYKNVYELNALKEIIVEIKTAVLGGAYLSKKNFNIYNKNKKDITKTLDSFINKFVKPVKKAKDIITRVVEIDNTTFEYNSSIPMPKVLENMLDYEFSKLARSTTQYLTNDNDSHFISNFEEFTSANAEILASLTQGDVDALIDYYTHSIPVYANMTDMQRRIYNSTMLWVGIHLLSETKLGNIVITEEQYNELNDKLESVVSDAGTTLAIWRKAKNVLKPAEVIVNSIARSTGINVTPEDVVKITDAIRSGNITKIEQAKQEVYLNTLKSHRSAGNKQSIWDKLLQFQRMAMLSGPGTWLRNIISNVTLQGINIKRNGREDLNLGLLSISDTLGHLFTKGNKREIKGQYKIYGTKVKTEVKNFVNDNFIKTGLLATIREGLNKYDTRNSNKRSPEENLSTMIVRSIATKIFYNNRVEMKWELGEKYLNKWYEFVFRQMSDDRYVEKRMLMYLGKMLTEDNVDLTNGITTQISNALAEAYTLAAHDFMHKSNFWNKIEADLKRELGDAAYFMYKQVFPFASASWNWFTEGLNYTPIGLLKNIINFAKLEDTIAKLEDDKLKGKNVISSRFAEYISKRNIGKGVIGSIGTFIGILLASFGVVKLDEEDDVYKLKCGDAYIDISGVFGSQGIFLGMSITQSIVDYNASKKTGEHVDFADLIAKSFNNMLLDSNFADMWNTIRYSNTIGDYLLYQPFKSLEMFVPNLLKTITSLTNPYQIKYNDGVLGKIERLASTIEPWSFPKIVDVYTGKTHLLYGNSEFSNFVINAFNKVLPFKIDAYNVTEIEKNAVQLGVKKGMLNGRYTINNVDVRLKSDKVIELNRFYGELNSRELELLINNKKKYNVKNDKGNFENLTYSKMTNKQKAAAIEQIMSKNSNYAKVYILTNEGYNYYATQSEYNNLIRLGITKNVYRATKNKNGFIKN